MTNPFNVGDLVEFYRGNESSSWKHGDIWKVAGFTDREGMALAFVSGRAALRVDERLAVDLNYCHEFRLVQDQPSQNSQPKILKLVLGDCSAYVKFDLLIKDGAMVWRTEGEIKGIAEAVVYENNIIHITPDHRSEDILDKYFEIGA